MEARRELMAAQFLELSVGHTRMSLILVDFPQISQQTVAFVGQVANSQQRFDSRGQLKPVYRLRQEVITASVDGLSMSPISFRAVTIRMGMPAVAASFLSCSHTS